MLRHRFLPLLAVAAIAPRYAVNVVGESLLSTLSALSASSSRVGGYNCAIAVSSRAFSLQLIAYRLKGYFDALAIRSRHWLCWLLLLQTALRHPAKRLLLRHACRLSAASQLPYVRLLRGSTLGSLQLAAIRN